LATIPASQIVQVLPSVLGAVGNQLQVIGLVVTQNTRVPIGQVLSFPLATSVNTYFGASAHEALMAGVYFTGFTGASGVPQALLFAQMPCTQVAAYMRGGNISTLTVPQLQGISGALSVTVDGYTRSGTINLSSATSFSAAGALIATTLNTGPATLASCTGSIGPGTASFTGSIQGNVLTVTAVAGGIIVTGGVMGTAGGVAANTLITGQLTQTGTAPGGTGTYAVSVAQAVTGTALTEAYGVLNITAITAGTLSVGQTVVGTGAAPSAGTLITQLGTAVGTVGTYYVNNSQTVGSIALTGQPTPVTVTFDSVSGALVLTSGVTGAASTAAFATGGAATLLSWTAATSAVLSQGANPMTPGAFMASVTAITQNWATFMTAFDPDFGVPGGAQKLLFSLWASQSPQNQAYAFITWDTDPSPTITVPATGSYGFALQQGNYTGTCLIWQPSDTLKQCFVSGAAASINFTQLNGRITFAFKSQAGLTADVTNATVAANLIANGYNFHGAYATAASNFVFFYPGSVSGPFLWLDSYVNQIWMNSNFQLTLMQLLQQVYSIPFNPAGYGLIDAACSTVITAAGNFGAFRAGVTLSQTEQAEVNSMAGLNIAQTLNQRGWYLQINDPGVAVRQARGSPQMNFWYMDGQSVQKIVMNSINVL
jgi:hypothetical protein